jgi:flagellin-like hook-associated protein FlgL
MLRCQRFKTVVYTFLNYSDWELVSEISMKNGKMLAMLSVLLLISFLTPILTNTAHAVHDAEVYWVDSSTPHIIFESTWPMVPNYPDDTIAIKSWTWSDQIDDQVNITFTVHNNGPADISRVQFYIQEKGVSNAFFHFYKGYAQANWNTEILEKDAKGWARLIAFTSPDTGVNIISGEARNFTVSFGAVIEQPVEGTYYNFTATTTDASGSSAEHFIHLMFDTTPPTVVITSPQNNQLVTGSLMAFCGNNYFMVAWHANDPSGLWYYEFLLNRTNDNTIKELDSDKATPLTTNDATYWWAYNFSTAEFTDSNGKHYTFFANSLDGHYKVDVWVADRLGNMAHEFIEFDYTAPQKPFWLTPTEGFASHDTSWDAVAGLVVSKQVSFGAKTLGTTVTASGYGFAPTTNPLVPVIVTITVRITTYDYFSGSNYEVPVAKTPTDAYGNFSVSFIFPKAPKGVYNVTATSSSTDPAYVTKCAASPQFTVSEKAIYKPLGDNPDVLIGPDVINVEATGFIATNYIFPETYTVYLLCNNKDALQGINQQVLWYWYFDGNGTLQNAFTNATGRFVENGIVWPSLQPGTYNLTLFLYSPGKWWNLDHWVDQTNDEYTNTVTVHETLSLLISIKDDTFYIRTGTDTINAKLDTLKPIVDRVDGNVVTINTTLGRIEATINQLSPVITRIENNTVTLNTTVGQINTTMATIGPQLEAISPTIARIETSVGTGLSGKVDSIQGNVTTIKTDVGDVQTQIPNLTTPIYVAVVFSIIAAIAAIACAFLVFRKIA